MSESGASSEVEPTGVLSFEPAEAQILSWLPLAVRYKLDQCGLKLGLDKWRSLPLAARRELLASREGDPFEALVVARLASECEQIEPRRTTSFQHYVQDKLKLRPRSRTDRIIA